MFAASQPQCRYGQQPLITLLKLPGSLHHTNTRQRPDVKVVRVDTSLHFGNVKMFIQFLRVMLAVVLYSRALTQQWWTHTTTTTTPETTAHRCAASPAQVLARRSPSDTRHRHRPR